LEFSTLALLNSALNIPTEKYNELGQTLTELKDFCAELDYETNGHVIVNSDKLREIHNSFARSDPFALDELERDSSGKEDA
jgi:ubiquitin carboxyl-terminal hydrolase L5